MTFLVYVVAFAIPILVVGGLNIRAALSTDHPVPALPDAALPTPPAHDDGKLTAVIVAGTTGAESIDLLVPYEILATSGAFNVYTVGPERRPLPLFPASPTLRGAHFVPHYSLDEYDATFAQAPDLVVVPWIPHMDREDNAQVAAWMRRHVGPDTTLLTICGGSWTAAQAGLLDQGATVTTHRNIFSIGERDHPEVNWVPGQRWIEDGRVISSGGITASMDATLHTLARLVDRDVADATARELGYPHTRFLDEPAYQPESADTRPVAIARAFHRNETDVALLLHDGVGEIELASIVDLYPRTATAAIHPVAVEDGLIRTRNGLHLLSDERLDDSGRDYDRLLIPGRPHPDIAAVADRWADSSTSAPEPIHVNRPDSFPFDAALDVISEHHPAAITRAVVAGIEYPYPRQAQGSTSAALLRRPLALGLLGLLTAAAVRRARLGTRHTPVERS